MNQNSQLVYPPEKQRIYYIDQLKGIAILLVVIGHFVQYNSTEGTNSPLFEIIYSFHMPLFMFLSGYIAEKTTKPKIFNNYLLYVKKKAYTLLIPFFTWPLLITPLFFQEPHQIHEIKNFLALIKSPGGGLWYLWYLFFMSLLYSAFLKLSLHWNQKKNVLIDICCFAIVPAALIAIKLLAVVEYIDSFILYSAFFFLGVFVSRYIFFNKMILKNYTFSICIITFAILCRWYHFEKTGVYNLILKIILSVSAIAILYFLANAIKWHSYAGKMISEWGRNSIVIYVTQFSIIQMVSKNELVPYMPPLLFTLISLAGSVLIIFACLSIARIAEFSNLLNLLLYGRIKKAEASMPNTTEPKTIASLAEPVLQETKSYQKESYSL